jgi:nickel/cobalt transporter (NiCoT) family protein
LVRDPVPADSVRSPGCRCSTRSNITVTGLSIVVALFIGTIELVGLLTQELGLTGPIVDWFRSFNINTAGFIIVRIFVGTWVIALAVWRIGRIEEK